MVSDAQAALDILVNLPYVDPRQIHVLGYSLGSLVGLHLGALDDRIAGLIAVCPPPPFRTDTQDKRTGGIDRWSKLHMLLPRLGYYTGKEEQVPYDIDQLLACHVPLPLGLVTPQLDRHAPFAEMQRAFESARAIYKLYGAGEYCEQIAPESYNQFGPEIQAPVFELLEKWNLNQ
jgi:pimeloyl-ACP methyl ester carboxylesterase